MKMTLNFKMFLKVDFIFISGGTTFARLVGLRGSVFGRILERC